MSLQDKSLQDSAYTRYKNIHTYSKQQVKL